MSVHLVCLHDEGVHSLAEFDGEFPDGLLADVASAMASKEALEKEAAMEVEIGDSRAE